MRESIRLLCDEALKLREIADAETEETKIRAIDANDLCVELERRLSGANDLCDEAQAAFDRAFDRTRDAHKAYDAVLRLYNAEEV